MNAPAPSVSVVIPAFDAASTLQSALESVAAQTQRPREVLVIDDGSADATGDLALRFFDRHPDLQGRLLSQSNAGPAAARARGVDSASGSHVALLDADDRWAPTKLETSMRCITGLQLDIVGSALTAPAGRRAACTLLDRRAMLFRNPYFTSTVVFAKAAYRRVGGFDVGQRYSEDYQLWLRFAWQEGCRAGLLSEPLATYRPARGPNRGLSTHQWQMARHEIGNYLGLFRDGSIGAGWCGAAVGFSGLKSLLRMARSRWQGSR